MDLDGYLCPQHFENIIKATLQCSIQGEDDDEDLKSPSNAIKLGHDIKRMLSAKLAKALINGDGKRKTEAEETLKLMDIDWGLRVTKLARIILNERSFNVQNKLPLPNDVKKLSTHLQNEINSLDLEDVSFPNFRRTAILTLARVTLFNRRRCHEVQALKISSYSLRKQGVDEVAQELRGELTAFEAELLKRQEMVVVRGKTGKGVPVILPQDVKDALRYLVDSNVRKTVGVPSCNPYVFANAGAGVFRAYEAIRSVAAEASLEMPNLVKTSNMRKYMATMLQALNTTEAERQWVMDHLGHTMEVHKIHYRMTSDILERVDVAKILLIQDMGLVGQFKGKRLEDIQLNELLPREQSVEAEQEMAPAPPTSPKRAAINPGQFDVDDVYHPDLHELEEDESKDDDRDRCRSRIKKRKAVVRQKWSKEEIEELQVLFEKEFKDDTCPRQKQLEAMMRRSKANGGEIHKRKRDTIKKKVCNMLVKRR